MTVVKTIFSQIQLCIGYFATSWDQVQWPGARLSCMTILLSPSLRQLSSCLSPVSVPRGQWEWSLHLKKGVIYGKTTVKPTYKKGHESNRVWWVPCVRLPGCPVLRHCRQGWATASPWWTYGLSQVESEVTGWPANILQEQELWHCMASHWVGHRCSCTQQCVQRGSCHHKAMSCTTSFVCTGAQADWWTNLPHPSSQFTDAWSEGWPRSAAWKAP